MGEVNRIRPVITFVIVNYNMSRQVARCVEGIEKNVSLPHDIVVVDNASSDSEWPIVKEGLASLRNVRLIVQQSNTGFGSACNTGAKLAESELLCFINPDVLVRDDFCTSVAERFDRDPVVSIYGIKSTVHRGMDFSAGVLPNIFLEMLNVLFVGRYVEASWISMRARIANRPIRTGWVIGACLFIRTSLFRKYGGFDEDYFLYFEEVDLCHRLVEAGEVVLYDAGTHVEHIGSVAGSRDYRSFTARFYTGKKKYFLKRHSGWRRRAFLLLVDLQLVSQYFLWSILGIFGSRRAMPKRHGLLDAMRYRGQALIETP